MRTVCFGAVNVVVAPFAVSRLKQMLSLIDLDSGDGGHNARWSRRWAHTDKREETNKHIDIIQTRLKNDRTQS